MYKHFKYLELNRHHLIKKTKKIVGENNAKDDKNFEQIVEVIFSSAMSLFISLMVNGFYGDYYVCPREIYEDCACETPIGAINPWLLFLIGICVYVAVFLITKYAYRFLSRKIRKHYLQAKINPIDISREKVKELIDDFDNIAFDYLLIAYDYVEQIDIALSKNKNEIATFYFHETLYYLRTAIFKTKPLLIDKRRELSLNIKGRTDGVDVFRLFNAYKMMKEVFESIKKLANGQPIEVSLYSSKLGKEIDHQLQLIQQDIDYIGQQCDRAENDLKS